MDDALGDAACNRGDEHACSKTGSGQMPNAFAVGRIQRRATTSSLLVNSRGKRRLASNRLVVQVGHPRVRRKCRRSLNERFFAGCRRSSARSLGEVSARVVLFMEKTY